MNPKVKKRRNHIEDKTKSIEYREANMISKINHQQGTL